MNTAKKLLNMARNELKEHPELQERIDSIIQDMETEKNPLEDIVRENPYTESEPYTITLRDVLFSATLSDVETDYKSRQHYMKKLQRGELIMKRLIHDDSTYSYMNEDILVGLKVSVEKEPYLLDLYLKVVDIIKQ